MPGIFALDLGVEISPKNFRGDHWCALFCVIPFVGQLGCGVRGPSFSLRTALKNKRLLNPKMKVWKMIFLFKQVIFRFKVLIFQGVSNQFFFALHIDHRLRFCHFDSWKKLWFNFRFVTKGATLAGSWNLVNPKIFLSQWWFLSSWWCIQWFRLTKVVGLGWWFGLGGRGLVFFFNSM